MENLQPLTPGFAEVIASWATSQAEVVLFAGPGVLWPLSANALLASDGEAGRQVLVLTDARDNPVATGSLVPKSDRVVRISWVLVDPARRGEGWGRRMLEALIARAESDPSVQATELGVFTHNRVALALYERLGFTPTATARTAEVGDESWHSIDLIRPRTTP